MIVGIGVDIIEIDRVRDAFSKNINLRKKFFTESEIKHLFLREKVRYESVAGYFAAKEAISKAIGTGFRNFRFLDIEVLKDDLGKPIAKIYNEAENIVKMHGEYIIHLSISHNNSNAIAYATIETI